MTGLPGQGRVGLAGQELGGGPRASVPEGVGGRGTGRRDGANFATCVVFLSFLTRTKRRKIAFFEGCPVEWGWPGGRGGTPRALVAGEGREGLAWRGKGSEGGARVRFRGGVGGRGMRPSDGANFATCVVLALFEGCPVGVGGGYPPELAWTGVDQGSWLQERVGGGVGADGSSPKTKKGGG